MPAAETLLSSPQSVTGSWADVGGEITTDHIKDLGFYVKITINNSQNVRFRLLALAESGGDEYPFATGQASGANILVEHSYFELNQDVDQDFFYDLVLNGPVRFLKVQVMAGTVGATPATVDSIKYTREV